MYLLLTVLLAACSSGSDDGISGSGTGSNSDDGVSGSGTGFILSGQAQKGPFTVGSRVEVRYVSGGRQGVFATRINSELGDYRIQLPSPGVVQVNINGRYYDELRARESSLPLALSAVADISQPENQININLATTLLGQRSLILMRSEGMGLAVAKEKALRELNQEISDVLRQALTLQVEQAGLFIQPDSDYVASGSLFAFTLTYWSYLLSREDNVLLPQRLRALEQDFAEDGKIDLPGFEQDVRNAVTNLDVTEPVSNLFGQFSGGNNNIGVANPNISLDSDLDGIANEVDTDDDGDGIPDAQDAAPYNPDVNAAPAPGLVPVVLNVSGLVGDLGLLINGSNSLQVSANGRVSAGVLLPGATAQVIVTQQPAGQVCNVAVPSTGAVLPELVLPVMCQAEGNAPPSIDALGNLDLALDFGSRQVAFNAVDPDGDALSLRVEHTGNVLDVSLDSQAQQIRLSSRAGQSGSSRITVFASSTANTAEVSRQFEVVVHQPPVSRAGVDQLVAPGDAVILNGSASASLSGRPLTYQWRQTQGPDIALVDAQQSATSIAANQLERGIKLSYELEVSDDLGQLSRDEVTIDSRYFSRLSGLSLSTALAGTGCVYDEGGVECWGLYARGEGRTLSTLNDNIQGVALSLREACAIQGADIMCAGRDGAESQVFAYSADATVAGQVLLAPESIQSSLLGFCVLDQQQIKCFSFGDSYQVLVTNQPVNVTTVDAFGMGGSELCAISSGMLTCWNMLSGLPVMTGVTGLVSDISVGPTGHGCAIGGGSVQCWGSDIQGRTTVPVGIVNPVRVVTGANFSCALQQDEQIVCWGLALGPTPVIDQPVVDLQARGTDICAITRDDLHCWGVEGLTVSRFSLQLDAAPVQLPSANGFYATQVAARLNRSLESVVNTESVSASEANAVSSVAIKFAASDTRCISTSSGVICDNSADPDSVAASALGEVGSLLAGNGAHLCVSHSGGVGCFGDNSLGQLNVPVSLGAPINALVAANNETCALVGVSPSREVQCWGDSNSPVIQGLPVSINDPGQLVVGDEYACVLDADNQLLCWGSGTVITELPALGEVQAIYGGPDDACAVVTVNRGTELTCWGGGAGVAFNDIANVPSHIKNPRVVTFDFGEYCSLHDSGSTCWGNSYRRYWAPPGGL